jgi:hypothetical protein
MRALLLLLPLASAFAESPDLGQILSRLAEEADATRQNLSKAIAREPLEQRS